MTVKQGRNDIKLNAMKLNDIKKAQNWQFVLDNKAGLTGDNLYCLIGVKSDDVGNYH